MTEIKENRRCSGDMSGDLRKREDEKGGEPNTTRGNKERKKARQRRLEKRL
jgi:hypothetical protein